MTEPRNAMKVMQKCWAAINRYGDGGYCLLIGGVTLISSILFYPGMQATDDLDYALRAYDLLNHGINLTDTSHHFGRIGAYWPLALIFWLFGTNSFSLALLPVISTVIASILLYFLGKKLYDPKTGLVASLLFAFFPLTLTYGALYLPEPIVCAEFCAAALLFLKSEDSNQAFYDVSKLCSGLLIGFAYLTTEAGVLMLPAMLLYRILSRKLNKNDISLIIGFISVLSLEMFYYYHFFGNPLFRFSGLGGNYTDDPMLKDANIDLFYRLFKAYPAIFIYPQGQLGFFGPFLLMGGLVGLIGFKRNQFLISWAAVIFLFYNFMSVKLEKYIALPVAERLIYPGCLPLLILSAMFCVGMWNWIKTRGKELQVIFKGLFIAALMWMVMASATLVYLTINTGKTAIIARNAEAVASFLKNRKEVSLVSDKKTLQIISFYRGFLSSDNLITFTEYWNLQSQGRITGNKGALILINGPIYKISEGESGWFVYDRFQKCIMDNIIFKATTPVYHFKYSRGIMFRELLSIDLVKALYGQARFEQARKSLLDMNAEGWIMVYQGE